MNASDSKNMITFNQLAEKVHTLASYYGLGLVSYTSVMRDVIYGIVQAKKCILNLECMLSQRGR